MNKTIDVSVFEAVGDPLCVASDAGEKVHDRIARCLKEQRRVTLSFRNVELLTSAFLNTAIGQLYGEFSEETIRELLSVKDMGPSDLVLLKRVVDNAKLYFKDPDRFDRALREAREEA